MARCPACDSPIGSPPRLRGFDRLHGLPGPFEVVVCGECGTGRTRPFVATDDLRSLYPSSYNAYALPAAPLARAAATGLFRWRYWRALRRLPLRSLTHRRLGRLLDVGSGRGDLGLVLGERGRDVTGLEPSPDACAEARSRGVRSECGTLTRSAELVGADFDAAFQHSLEHVAEPADDLAVARGLLRPGGFLIVSLPNFASTQARRFGTDWFHLDLPRHRTHFTPRGLEHLLERCDYAVESLSTSSSAYGLPMSLHYRRFGDRRARSGAGRYLTIAAVLLASPLGTAVDRAAGAGDLLHAVARRPGE
jgi:SAM-dependent methyltransferase